MKQISRRSVAGKATSKRINPTKTENINKVLKEAYGRYFRDKVTRLALRQCLG